MTILGIDLGTTNSACSIWRNGKVELIPNRLGQFLTPSVVGVDDGGEVLVGESAKHRLISHPTATASIFKRYMGTDHAFQLSKKSFSAVELSSLILRSLKEDAENFLGESIEQAVISVPAYFNDLQRKATKQAGELAGLQVERLINEPTAAAMVYGLHDRNEGTQFLVLDMGGGTFDVTLVEYFSGVLEVHASSGDNYLGGEDFLNMMVDRFLEDHQQSKEKLPKQELQHLIDTLNQAKHQLSYDREVKVENALKKQSSPWTINREQFEKLVSPLLHRVQTPVERTLHDADISPSEIGDVVLVGGATRMQAFRSLISKMFRRMPSGNIDPDLVVAMGAGIQAGLKEKNSDLDDIVLTDVCPYTLGTEIHNAADHGRQGGLFMPIIERNSIVPISIERSVCTVGKNQTEMVVNIYQGESRLVKNNVFLGAINTKVPRGPAGKETLDIRYSYDMNGLLEVDVTVTSTGKKYQKTIINSPSDLSDSEISASKKKLATLKFHPRESEENRTLLAKAERLYESALGEKRDVISQLTSEFERVLEEQNPQKIKHATQEFKNALEQLEQDNLFQ